MTWPRLPLQSHILHLSHPTVVSSILVGLHLSKAYFVLFRSMCLYLVHKYHFPSRLLLPPPALLSLYDLIYIQNFSKIPELLSLALNCLLGATPLFISAYYTCTLEHFTYTSSSTSLELNSLFLYICSSPFVSYLIWGVIFPAGIQYGNMSLFRFFLMSSQYPVTSSPTDYILHYLLKDIPYSPVLSLQSYFKFSPLFNSLRFLPRLPVFMVFSPHYCLPLQFCNPSSKLLTQ